MNIMQTFSARLRTLREESKLTQVQLAEALNVSRGSISFYENGDRVPDIQFLEDVARYFEVSSDFLLGHTDVRNEADSQRYSFTFDQLNSAFGKLSERTQFEFANLLNSAIELNDPVVNEYLFEIFHSLFRLVRLYFGARNQFLKECNIAQKSGPYLLESLLFDGMFDLEINRQNILELLRSAIEQNKLGQASDILATYYEAISRHGAIDIQKDVNSMIDNLSLELIGLSHSEILMNERQASADLTGGEDRGLHKEKDA